MVEENNQENPQRIFRILAQAVQDFSFENTGFGKAIQTNGQSPEISVSVNLRTAALPDVNDIYTASIIIKAFSKINEENLFILDVTYGGIFEIKGFDAAIHDQILNIQAPNLLFPFLRQIVAQAAANGNYPPLYLDPVDFASLYFQRQQEKN